MGNMVSLSIETFMIGDKAQLSKTRDFQKAKVRTIFMRDIPLANEGVHVEA